MSEEGIHLKTENGDMLDFLIYIYNDMSLGPHANDISISIYIWYIKYYDKL